MVTRIINCLGAYKALGYGRKGPALVAVAEQAIQQSAFKDYKDPTSKHCHDRYNKVLTEHRTERRLNESKTGSDDEEVYDAKGALDCEQTKKKDAEKGLVAAGARMRDFAMNRGFKRGRLEEGSAEAGSVSLSPPCAVQNESVVDAGSDSDDAAGAAGTAAAALRASSPTGGPASVTPKSADCRADSQGGRWSEHFGELKMIEAAEVRKGKKVVNDSARLVVEQENASNCKADITLRVRSW